MKRVVLTALVASLAFLTGGFPAAADNADDITPYIVGGKQAAEGAYPWATRIRMPDGTKKGGYFVCTAALISPDILLTAQHCVTPDPTEVEAYIGKVDWKQAEAAGGKRVGHKWKKGPGPHQGDWAIVKLDSPYDAKIYPQLPADTSHDQGPQFRAMGWGKTAETDPHSSQFLNEVDLPWIDDQKCGLQDGKTEICAGDWENGGKDTCSGDSGGPLVNKVGDNWIEVGVTSWGIGCGRPQTPGHYTKVSTFTKDILAAITELGGKQPPMAG